MMDRLIRQLHPTVRTDFKNTLFTNFRYGHLEVTVELGTREVTVEFGHGVFDPILKVRIWKKIVYLPTQMLCETLALVRSWCIYLIIWYFCK